MKLNPKHHNPELSSQIDVYYDETYGSPNEYDSCYYDDYDYDYDYYPAPEGDSEWIEYTWLVDSDRATTCTDNIKDFDGCRVYENYDETYEYEIYSTGGWDKLTTFFSLIMIVMKETKSPSERVKRIYSTLVDRYPEIYIKLLDKDLIQI